MFTPAGRHGQTRPPVPRTPLGDIKNTEHTITHDTPSSATRQQPPARTPATAAMVSRTQNGFPDNSSRQTRKPVFPDLNKGGHKAPFEVYQDEQDGTVATTGMTSAGN